MPRYFFHLRTGAGDEITDGYGDELPDAAAAEEQAIASAKDLLRSALLDWPRVSFEVHDDENRHVVTVWFSSVVAAGSSRPDPSLPADNKHALTSQA